MQALRNAEQLNDPDNGIDFSIQNLANKYILRKQNNLNAEAVSRQVQALSEDEQINLALAQLKIEAETNNDVQYILTCLNFLLNEQEKNKRENPDPLKVKYHPLNSGNESTVHELKRARIGYNKYGITAPPNNKLLKKDTISDVIEEGTRITGYSEKQLATIPCLNVKTKEDKNIDEALNILQKLDAEPEIQNLGRKQTSLDTCKYKRSWIVDQLTNGRIGYNQQQLADDYASQVEVDMDDEKIQKIHRR